MRNYRTILAVTSVLWTVAAIFRYFYWHDPATAAICLIPAGQAAIYFFNHSNW